MRGTKFVGAYNAAIAAELHRRVKATDPASHTVTAATMHSAGFTAWRQRYPKAALDKTKTRLGLRQLAAEDRRPFAERYADYACDMVSFAMNAGLGLEDPRDLQDDKRRLAISALRR